MSSLENPYPKYFYSKTLGYQNIVPSRSTINHSTPLLVFVIKLQRIHLSQLSYTIFVKLHKGPNKASMVPIPLVRKLKLRSFLSTGSLILEAQFDKTLNFCERRSAYLAAKGRAIAQNQAHRRMSAAPRVRVFARSRDATRITARNYVFRGRSCHLWLKGKGAFATRGRRAGEKLTKFAAHKQPRERTEEERRCSDSENEELNRGNRLDISTARVARDWNLMRGVSSTFDNVKLIIYRCLIYLWKEKEE